MKKLILKNSIAITVLFLTLLFASCGKKEVEIKYDNILDISYTPDTIQRFTTGNFSDLGSWMGFSIPQKDKWVNGLIGPFSFYEYGLKAISIAEASFKDSKEEVFTPDSINYYPGGIFISASNETGKIEQELIFATSSIALLNIRSDSNQDIVVKGNFAGSESIEYSERQQIVRFVSSDNEDYLLIFPDDTHISGTKSNYEAIIKSKSGADAYVAIVQLFKDSKVSNYTDISKADKLVTDGASKTTESSEVNVANVANEGRESNLKNEESALIQTAQSILENPENYFQENKKRWNGYISEVIREELDYNHNRVAVKSIVTLISNWRSARGELFHDGVIPSHAVGYFVGFWAWDSWKIAVALSRFEPVLAKNSVRSMFDYQLEDGMVIDCIYPDASENNYRDSKPPLAAWAVNEIYEQTGDIDFLRELYPKLIKYYVWWYEKRDHDKNGICEFGSVDGTVEAAAWESGMDNAIRFDNSVMVQNGDDAWSLNQESVELNFYLAYEEIILKKFAQILNETFEVTSKSIDIADHFYDKDDKFFYDKRIDDQAFVKVKGAEVYTPLWTGLASKEQFEAILPTLKDENKFSTYIPFPTASADEEKFSARGYWRGPIWLDQTYFAINGIRKYGENELADNYTKQVFERIEGLQNGAPIHENYDPYTGKRLKAPHFSWSAAHLLLLYEEFKTEVKN